MTKYFNYCFSPSNFPLTNLIFYLFTLLLFCSSDIHSQTLTAEQIYNKVSNTIVKIQGYNNKKEIISQGSGIILKDRGFVITNYHVLSEAASFEILRNDKVIQFDDIVGIDMDKDVVIFKIKKIKTSNLKICNSQSLRVGQKVYAIGNPLGFENTISEGIISGLRDELGKNYIQITASISGGSSGGAVVNEKGELIGISSFTIRGGQNLNFAIPITDVLNIELTSYFANNTYKDFEWFTKGEKAYDNQDYTMAIYYYDKFISLQNYHSAAYNNRGLAKKKLNNFKDAIIDFNKALELNPNSFYANYNLGLSYMGLNDSYLAIEYFNKVIKINPNFDEVYCNLGLVKSHALKDYRNAIQDFTKAIEINNKYADAYIYRGIAKYFLNDTIGACLDFSKGGELGDTRAYDLIKKYCN